MKKSLKFTTSFLLAISLAACGGGGGGGDATAVSAEGVWAGTTSTGYELNVLVLENNEIWTMFGITSGGTFSVYGFDNGTGSASGSTFSGTIKEYLYTGATDTGTLSATTVKDTSLNGSATYSSGTSTFALTPNTTTTYNYNTAASLTTVSGNWTGSLLDGSAASIAITSGGAITGTSGGCSFTGTAAPRASGKNVFNVSLTFGAAPCSLPSQTATGIALAYNLSGGRTQLLVTAVDSTKAHGTMFFANR